MARFEPILPGTRIAQSADARHSPDVLWRGRRGEDMKTLLLTGQIAASLLGQGARDERRRPRGPSGMAEAPGQPERPAASRAGDPAVRIELSVGTGTLGPASRVPANPQVGDVTLTDDHSARPLGSRLGHFRSASSRACRGAPVASSCGLASARSWGRTSTRGSTGERAYSHARHPLGRLTDGVGENRGLSLVRSKGFFRWAGHAISGCVGAGR